MISRKNCPPFIGIETYPSPSACPVAARPANVRQSEPTLRIQGPAALPVDPAECQQTVLEYSAEIFYTLDAEYKLTGANRNISLLGYRAEEVTGSRITARMHPADIKPVAAVLRQCLSDKKPAKDLRFRIRHKEGTWYWLQASAVPFFDAGGNLIALSGLARDISAQVAKENAQKENEGRYQTFVQQISGGVWRFELKMPLKIDAPREEIIEHFYAHCYVAECNDAMAQMYGFEKKEDILGQDCAFFLPRCEPSSRAFINDFIDSDFRLKNYLSYEEDIFGNPKVFLNNVTAHIENGYMLRTWGTQRDITEKREAEEKVLFLANIVEKASDAIFSTDTERKIITWNKACEELFGFAAADVTGKVLSDIISFDLGPLTYRQVLLQVIETGNWKGEISFTNKAGKKIIMLTAVDAITDKKGSISSFILLHRDITERKATEEQLLLHSTRNTKILNSITDGFIAIDKSGTIVMWNQKMEQVYGLSATRAIGQPVSNFFGIYKNTPAYAILKNGYQLKKQVQAEHFLPEQNRWMEVSLHPFNDGYFTYFKDITARKRRELLMQLQKDVLSYNSTPGTTLAGTAQYLISGLQNVLPGTRILIMKADKKEEYLYPLVSQNLPPGFTEANRPIPVGYRKGSCGTAACIKKPVFSTDIDTDPVWEENRAFIRQFGIRAAFSFPIINNRKKVLATIAFYYDHVHEPGESELEAMDHMLPALSIIMEKRNAEEEVRLSNERFTLINKATNEGIVDHDLISGHSFWGDGLKRLTGYDFTGKEVPAGFWVSKVHPDDIQELLQIANSFYHAENTLIKEVEFRLRKANGHYAIVSGTGFIVRDETGRPIRVVGALRDITGQKKLEQKLISEMVNKQKAIHKASLDGSEKERQAISRELHDNVNQILSATKLYLEIARIDEEKREIFIDRCIGFIMSTITEIRKLSRSLASPTLGDLGLKEALNTLVQELVHTEKLKIRFTYASDLPQSFDDTLNLAVYRIVQEQLTNILKYAQTESATIDLKKKKGDLLLTIRDKGVGFDKKKLRKGLGLSNITNRASLLNGSMALKTAPGKGCTLTVTIPLGEATGKEQVAIGLA